MSNTLKTHMPKPKRPQQCLYHEDCRKGKIFDMEDAQNRAEELAEAGWVDTPAKLKPLPEEEKEIPVITEKSTPDDIKRAAEALGYSVLNGVDLQQLESKVLADLTDENLIAMLEMRGITYKPTKEELVALCGEYGIDLAEEEPLINRFFKGPTDLTKEELVVLGAEYSLKLKMTQKEETMIGLITTAIEESKKA